MQLALGYTPLEVGLTFLPATMIMAVFSLGLSARIVMRFGIRAPLCIGLLFGVLGLAVFARAPLDGNITMHILPGMIVLGAGGGIAFNPLLLAATSDVSPSESGLAWGIMNTSFLIGGAIGLAVLVSVATARSTSLLESGASVREALAGGYRIAFLSGAAFAGAAAVLGATLRTRAHWKYGSKVVPACEP
jgi:MFS family permease